ncbi:hypothetical protein C0989_004057, partial [Termitomyces sp. Mn162]
MIQHETVILDIFIVLKVHGDVWADDPELHLERDEAYTDLFDHVQPCARLEDLVRVYGVQSGVICLGSSGELLEGNGSVIMQARTSNDTLVPSQPQQEPYTESKPHLFLAGSTYLPLHSLQLPVPFPLHGRLSINPPHKQTFTSSDNKISIRPLPVLKFRQKPSVSPSPSSPSSTESSSSFSSSTHPPYPEPQTKTTPIPMSNLTITLTPRS